MKKGARSARAACANFSQLCYFFHHFFKVFLTANADRRAVRFTLAEYGREEEGGTLSSTNREPHHT